MAVSGNGRLILILGLVVAVAAAGFLILSPGRSGVEVSAVQAAGNSSAENATPEKQSGSNSPVGVLAALHKRLDGKQPLKPYIVINTHANKLTYRTRDSVLMIADCSTGSGGELIDSVTGRKWIFNTPRGIFKVGSKIKEPWWRKPDWAFLEDGESVPKNEQERLDPRVMGDYAMGFGDGYFIHGTIYERLLGVGVTHGCVRLGSKDLGELYQQVTIGTPVYIF